MGTNFEPSKSHNKYKFVDDKRIAVCSPPIIISVKGYRVIKFEVEIVTVDVPILIGLYFLDCYKMYVNTLENVLCVSH